MSYVNKIIDFLKANKKNILLVIILLGFSLFIYLFFSGGIGNYSRKEYRKSMKNIEKLEEQNEKYSRVIKYLNDKIKDDSIKSLKLYHKLDSLNILLGQSDIDIKNNDTRYEEVNRINDYDDNQLFKFFSGKEYDSTTLTIKR